MKMLSDSFKDLVIVSENSPIISKFLALLRSEDHKLLFGVHNKICTPSNALKIY